MLNLEKNKVTSDGGLESYHAQPMGLKANLLPSFTLPVQEMKLQAPIPVQIL